MSAHTRRSFAAPCAGWTRLAKWIRPLLVLAFILVFAFSARLLMIRRFNVADRALRAIPAHQSDLPREMGGWQVVAFEHKIRNDAFGPESSMWTLRHGTQQAIVSVDGPYSEYHPLERCYAGIGWNVSTTLDYAGSGAGTDQSLNATRIALSKADSSGFVLFSAFDLHGKLVPGRSSLGGIRHGHDIVGNLKSVFGLTGPDDRQDSEIDLPIYQIQVLYQTLAGIGVEDEREIETLFRQTRAVFLATQRFRTATDG